MKYEEQVIKGISYQDLDSLHDTANSGGFLSFIEEFKDLAETHAKEILEEFITDHFPEDSKCKEKIRELSPFDVHQFIIDLKAGKFVHPFTFTRLLHEHSANNDVFAIGSSGNAPTSFFQSYKIKQGQRVSNISTIGAMGADIPMALGAAMATGRRVICVTGDGGFQMNAQELETIRRFHLPIIFFVMNNGGYNSIRVGQLARFGRVTGANPATGFTMPQIEDLAHVYGFMYHKLDGNNLDRFDKCFTAAPLIVEVMIDPEWQELPRVMASGVGGSLRTDDFHDMTPKLSAEELKEIMEA